MYSNGRQISLFRAASSRASSSRLRRPQSTPLVLPQSDTSSEGQDERYTVSDRYNYDTLTPAILYQLANGQVPESVYGERPLSAHNGDASVHKESKDDTEEEEVRETVVIGGSEQENVVNAVVAKIDLENDKIGTAERESDDDSDDENIPEPEVDKIKMANLPNLKLRPEKADALHVPWAKGDQRKYDFDAEHLDQPTYQFKEPLSSQMSNLNLRDLSKTEKHWREMVSLKPVDAVESKLISRLIEFEKLQRKTIEMEKERKLRGVRGVKSRVPTPQSNSRSRLDMNCCPECIQAACVGNCPNKKLPSGVCIFCSEKDCKENCQNSVYESRTRTADRCNFDDQDSKFSKTATAAVARPRTCPSCQQKYLYNSRPANGSQTSRVMSRPRSGYSLQRTNSVKAKELKPKPCMLNNEIDLEEEFAKLGIVPAAGDEEGWPERSRPLTAGSGSARRLRGRAAILPGKSFFSQRKESLTDVITKEEKIRLAVIATKKRLRSAKKKRPKTAM